MRMSDLPDFIRAPDAMQPIETDISICPGLFVKTAVFAQGTYIPQHSHAFPHLSVVATGAVRVWADGELLGDFAAPAGIHIKARVKHLFLALLDRTTVLCIHRLNDDGEIGIAEEHRIVED
jgi:quercetin dioxygenase-like cupin family protein